MARVRRIRYTDHFKVPNDNPYHKPGEGPEFFWRNWIEVDVFGDADVRQLGSHGYAPGKQFQLRVPMRDPESGEMLDVDGDPALMRVIMVGAELEYRLGPTFKGFVSLAELAHEKAYRVGDLDGCLAAHEGEDHKYVIEEWQVLEDEPDVA